MKKHTINMSVQELNDQIFKLFHGLQDGSVKYEYDNLCCAMKVSICEVFSNMAEDFVITVMDGREVTSNQLQTLHDNLISFGKDFAVKEAIALAEKIMPIIEK